MILLLSVCLDVCFVACPVTEQVFLRPLLDHLCPSQTSAGGQQRAKCLPAGLLLQFCCLKFCQSRNFSLLALMRHNRNAQKPSPAQNTALLEIFYSAGHAIHNASASVHARPQTGETAPLLRIFGRGRMMAEARTAYSTPRRKPHVPEPSRKQ